MKKLLALAFGVALIVGSITPVYAVPGVVCGESCQVMLTIGNQDSINVSSFIVQDPTTHLFGLPAQSDALARILAAAGDDVASNISVGATINPDPSIVFSLSGTNLTAAPLFFGLHISTPISLNGTINASSSIAYTLTDDGTGGVQLNASPSTHVAVFTDGFPIINKGVDVGPSVNTNTAGDCNPLVAGGTTTCPNGGGSYTATHTFTTSGPVTVMNADLGLFISAHDTFSLSGQVTQNQATVPEPATVLLMGSGLLGLAGWRRYSSRG